VNEQIKKIMRQACKQSMRPESVLEDVPQDVLAKFAELIVRECADFVVKRAEYQSDLGIKTMIKITGYQIKDHFGVE
jgi:thiamine pyrophosphate-dependent acetolactate synthase large subunit-like protein